MLGVRAVALVGLALGACVSPISLENRPCPCLSAGYRCCEPARICVREALACPAQSGAVQPPPPPVDAPMMVAGAADAGQPPPPDAAPLATDAALPAPDAAPPDAAPADAAPDLPPVDSGPRWQTLGQTGLSELLATSFDLQIADDGTPFLMLSKLRLPGSSRATTVLRYDGSDWQQVGTDLPGSESPPGFVLTGEGTAYVRLDGVLSVLEQGSYREVPEPPPPMLLPPSPLGLARDGQGRFYTFVGEKKPTGGYQLGVARLSGTTWQLLGPPDSFGSAPTPRVLQLAADRDGPYVADNDLDEVNTDIRHWTGNSWVPVGGEPFAAQRGVLMVALDGQVYFAPSGRDPIKRGSATAPWIDLPALAIATDLEDVPPTGLAAGTDNVLHVAYLGDRDPGPGVMPGTVVARLEGERFAALTLAGLETDVFDSVKLRVGRSGGAEVVYLAYSRELRVFVKKLQR